MVDYTESKTRTPRLIVPGCGGESKPSTVFMQVRITSNLNRTHRASISGDMLFKEIDYA